MIKICPVCGVDCAPVERAEEGQFSYSTITVGLVDEDRTNGEPIPRDVQFYTCSNCNITKHIDDWSDK